VTASIRAHSGNSCKTFSVPGTIAAHDWAMAKMKIKKTLPFPAKNCQILPTHHGI
jgi:hypothetical protein